MEKRKVNTEKTSGNSRSSEAFCVFNDFEIPMLPAMNYCMDGLPGRRVLFISEESETVVISFEQGMECLDIFAAEKGVGEAFHSEYRLDNKYLHQLKLKRNGKEGLSKLVYFRIEITDEEGMVHICPGQMLVSEEYKLKAGIEPILVDLMSGIAVRKAKGGG